MREFQCGIKICLNFRILVAAYIHLHTRTYPNLEAKKKKKIIIIVEKSRECLNHKLQPTNDMKRKRTQITNARNINKQMQEKHHVQVSILRY